MAKARKFGYFGACDSIESLKMVAQDAVDAMWWEFRLIPRRLSGRVGFSTKYVTYVCTAASASVVKLSPLSLAIDLSS